MAKPGRKASRVRAKAKGAGRGPQDGAVKRRAPQAVAVNGAATLTRRELQCLDLLANGLRSEQIAFELKVARVTVDFHIANAKSKLKAITREQAIALAIRGGYLPA